MSRMRLKALTELMRPELPISAGICVIVGQIIALGRLPAPPQMFLGFSWAFFLSAPAMILNDYFDIEVDKVNAPHRPLPSGLVTPRDALYLTISATLSGLAVSALIGETAILMYAVFWLLGFLYNWKYKEKGLAGNLLVSSSVGVTFVFGALTVGSPWDRNAWILSLMAFFFNLAMEIAADAMDMEGDRRRNVTSIALLAGRDYALRVSGCLFLLVIAVSLLPVIFNWQGTAYLIMIIFADSMILYFGVRLLKSKTPDEGRKSLRGAYLSLLFGFVAFIAGAFYF